MANELLLKPIGYFRCNLKQPFEAAHQSTASQNTSLATIHLEGGNNFEQALTGLNTFSHIWLVFGFHHNSNWKPMVKPPRGDEKIGVLATRAPYRPNPIGISCVELVSVDKLTITVRNFDLLDGTPIYDIKPYMRDADSFTDASLGWLENVESYEVTLSLDSEEQLHFLEQEGVSQIRSFILQQLKYNPTDDTRKRVYPKVNAEDEKDIAENKHWILAYRTWRIEFELTGNLSINVIRIFSGYSNEDLLTDEDPYQDKGLHKKYITSY